MSREISGEISRAVRNAKGLSPNLSHYQGGHNLSSRGRLGTRTTSFRICDDQCVCLGHPVLLSPARHRPLSGSPGGWHLVIVVSSLPRPRMILVLLLLSAPLIIVIILFLTRFMVEDACDGSVGVSLPRSEVRACRLGCAPNDAGVSVAFRAKSGGEEKPL